MKPSSSSVRSRFGLALLLTSCSAVVAQSCGGSTSKRALADFEAGAAGEREPAVAGRGGKGAGGASGGNTNSSGGENSSGNGGSSEAAGTGNTAAEGGAGGEPERIPAAGAGGASDDLTAGAGGAAAGEGGAACESASTGPRILIAFDTANAERVTSLQWIDSAAQTTPNVIGQGGPLACNDPSEFFGQAYGAPEGNLPIPVVAGGLSTLVHCGLEATITSATQSCSPAATPQPRVTTRYHFYEDSRESELRITRTFGFDATNPHYPNAVGLRPFVPRVALGALPNVIYPNQAGNGITTIPSTNCAGDCLIPVGATWNGKWFADVNAAGLALIVLRDPSMTAPVDLTVNYDSYSNANLASFVLLQPAAPGWQAPVTEIEYLCFADLTSWPQAQRDAAQLPAHCGP